MLAYDDPHCRECVRRNKRDGRATAKPGACFPVEVSRLERAIGIERFQCDKCGAVFAFRRDAISGELTADYARCERTGTSAR